MAVVLWGSRTPGAAQVERDKNVTNNKKKVSLGPERVFRGGVTGKQTEQS